MAKRTRITRPYPTHSIQEALPIAETIQRVNGGQPVRTEHLAEALGTSARSSAFIQKLNASSKYGLTTGSYSDEFIELTELGESATAPGSEEERDDSIREAVTRPEIFGRFYQIYSGKRMPEDIYASNTLVRLLGVPPELTEECLSIIRRNGLASDIVSDQSGVLVVGVLADSQDAGYYAAEQSNGRRSEKDSGADESDDTERGSEILVVSDPDDPIHREVTELVEGLSVPCKSVNLDVSGGSIIPQTLSDALESARGCVFIWTRDSEDEDGRLSDAKTWAALGAVSYRLRQRLVVVLRDGDGASYHQVSSDPAATVIHAAQGESVYPKLMASLVQSGIVKISVG